MVILSTRLDEIENLHVEAQASPVGELLLPAFQGWKHAQCAHPKGTSPLVPQDAPKSQWSRVSGQTVHPMLSQPAVKSVTTPLARYNPLLHEILGGAPPGRTAGTRPPRGDSPPPLARPSSSGFSARGVAELPVQRQELATGGAALRGDHSGHALHAADIGTPPHLWRLLVAACATVSGVAAHPSLGSEVNHSHRT